MKTCKTCHARKELKEFYKDSRTTMKDGLYADCKGCVRRRVEANQQKQTMPGYFNVDKEMRYYKF